MRNFKMAQIHTSRALWIFLAKLKLYTVIRLTGHLSLFDFVSSEENVVILNLLLLLRDDAFLPEDVIPLGVLIGVLKTQQTYQA